MTGDEEVADSLRWARFVWIKATAMVWKPAQ